VVIEWPDKFPESLPEDYVKVCIQRTGVTEEGRRLTFSSVGEKNQGFIKELESFVHTSH